MRQIIVRAAIGIGGLFLILLLALGLWPVRPDVPQIGAGGHAGAPTAPTGGDVRGSGQTIAVQPGESIQSAVDQAQPGDTIRVLPGTYYEEVLVQTESLTLAGVLEGDQRPILDGETKRANGILGVGNYFSVTGFRVQNYTSNGVTVQGITGVVFRDLITDQTGEYGLFPILSTDILIERCVTSGVIDTGIYVGQSTQIVVRDSEAFGNVSGVEIENSTKAVVENNYLHDNTGGILVFLLPGKTAAEGYGTQVINNRIINNNLPNFARSEMTVALVPAGTGLLIMSADTTEVTGNTFEGNKSFAVGVVAMTDFPGFFGDRKQWDVPTRPDGNWIHDNTYLNNAYDPAPGVIEAGFEAADLEWSTTGFDNRWDDPAATRFPSLLPASAWPTFFRRIFERSINFLAHL